MKKNKKGLVLSILGILGLIVITAGVTYAFFNYTKQGTTENSITTGTITFLYTEVSGVGRGISIDDAYPISDEVGKAQTGEGNVFDFKVTSTTPNNASIPYEVTARKSSDSDDIDEYIRVYLTKVSGTTEEEVLLDNYSNLESTSVSVPDGTVEKTIYTDTVPANSTNYEQNFRLRMWLDEDTDFSDGSMNGKTFTLTVNVYANATVVSDTDIENESNAELSSISIDGTELTKVEEQDYQYETSLPEGTTSTIINIETVSENATVEVEKTDSLAYETSSIKRLSANKTLELEPGDNYFKITVTSENGKETNSYILKIRVLGLLSSATTLSIGDAVTGLDGSKWHVLEASISGTDVVVLLSDYNLNSDGSYNTACQGISGNADSYKCSTMTFDSDNTNTYDENDTNNIGYFIKNTYTPLVTSVLSGTTNVTLPTAEQIATADNQVLESFLSLTSSWLLTTNYWTKNADVSSSNYVLTVDGYYKNLNNYCGANSSTYYGVRPVITTPKTNLIAE